MNHRPNRFLPQYEHHLRSGAASPARASRGPLRVVRLKTAKKKPLTACRATHSIYIDATLTLENVPDEAWQYVLGNRCAIEWVLDQYREKLPKDPTIRAIFHTYRLADYREEVADLLAKVCTVSVEHMRLINSMPASPAARPTPRTPAEAVQMLLDFSQPVEPIEPPGPISLALTLEQSDYYLEHWQGEHAGDALECLMDAHGYAWPAQVLSYDTTIYWQGIATGRRVASLLLTPSS